MFAATRRAGSAYLTRAGYNADMRARIGLLLWIVGILFPLAWLGRFSGPFRQAFEAVFSPAWMHVVMHAGLFTGLVGLLFLVFRWDVTRGSILRTLVIATGIGLLQEGFQALTRGALLSLAVLFDLGVDLSGAGLGLMAIWLWQTKRSVHRAS